MDPFLKQGDGRRRIRQRGTRLHVFKSNRGTVFRRPLDQGRGGQLAAGEERHHLDDMPPGGQGPDRNFDVKNRFTPLAWRSRPASKGTSTMRRTNLAALAHSGNNITATDSKAMHKAAGRKQQVNLEFNPNSLRQSTGIAGQPTPGSGKFQSGSAAVTSISPQSYEGF